MQKHSIIDIWQGSKYISAVSFSNIFHFPDFLCLYTWINMWKFCFSSESMQLHCSCDVNQKCNLFYWFPNHLLYIDHGNTKFSYIDSTKMRKSSLWKTWRWNARLMYTINKNNKNNNKIKDRITKASKQNNFIYYISKIFLLCTLNYIASFNFFRFFYSNILSILWSLSLLLPKVSASGFYCLQIWKNKMLGNLKY